MGFEINFDGIVGPTHNYSGLSFGNVASSENKLAESNPKAAALQGLEKMWFLASMGIKQAILPPHERPHLHTLRAIGYRGSDEDILAKAAQNNPELLLACSSAAAMWTANAATIGPSPDCNDGHLHIIPANLNNKFHRSIEPPMTAKFLKAIFPDPVYFVHHQPLPSSSYFSDEGAANHTRFCAQYGQPGVQLFVYGRFAFKENLFVPSRYPARQTFEASEAIARLHQINPDRVVFAQQNPKAIDAGVFHNDVISVGNRNVFFYHEQAFVGKELVIEEIRHKVKETCNIDMIFIEVPEKRVPLKDAVSSYLFNSQLLSLPDETMTLIAPMECQSTPSVRAFLEEMTADPQNPIRVVHYINLRESMRNGGGPACLRLRVVLSEKELEASNENFYLSEKLYNKLKAWINKYYRNKLHPKDLCDPKLLKESREALNELTKILNCGSIYDFQQG